MHLVERSSRWIGDRMPRQAVDVTLEVPVLQYGARTWVYREASLPAGTLFLLTTDRYRFRGLITSVGNVTPVAAGAPPLK
jgi:hypothetical protein